MGVITQERAIIATLAAVVGLYVISNTFQVTHSPIESLQVLDATRVLESSPSPNTSHLSQVFDKWLEDTSDKLDKALDTSSDKLEEALEISLVKLDDALEASSDQLDERLESTSSKLENALDTSHLSSVMEKLEGLVGMLDTTIKNLPTLAQQGGDESDESELVDPLVLEYNRKRLSILESCSSQEVRQYLEYSQR